MACIGFGRVAWASATFLVLQLWCRKDTPTARQIEHHAKPKRPLATAPLRTGADTCKTGAGAGSCDGPKTELVCRRSNHERTEDHGGRRRFANADAAGGWWVHSVDDTPSRKRRGHRQILQLHAKRGDGPGRRQLGSTRNRTRQAMAASTETQSEENSTSDTAFTCCSI